MNPNSDSISIEMVSTSTFKTDAAYPIILQEIRDTTSRADGNVIHENPMEGIVTSKFKYGINPFGIRVSWQMREIDDRWLSVEASGYLSDAIDTFGKAHNKAEEQISDLVERLKQHYAATVSGVPLKQPTPARPPRLSSPEPRTSPRPPSIEAPGQGAAGQATWALVLGIIGILILGPFTGIPALILGALARSKMHRTKNFNRKAAATWGLGLGIASSVLGSVVFWLSTITGN